MNNISCRVSYMLLAIMTFLGFCSKQIFLNEHRIALLVWYISIPFLVYFHLHFKRFTYHRMVKKFESMNKDEFRCARKSYARINMETRQAYS